MDGNVIIPMNTLNSLTALLFFSHINLSKGSHIEKNPSIPHATYVKMKTNVFKDVLYGLRELSSSGNCGLL